MLLIFGLSKDGKSASLNQIVRTIFFLVTISFVFLKALIQTFHTSFFYYTITFVNSGDFNPRLLKSCVRPCLEIIFLLLLTFLYLYFLFVFVECWRTAVCSLHCILLPWNCGCCRSTKVIQQIIINRRTGNLIDYST